MLFDVITVSDYHTVLGLRDNIQAQIERDMNPHNDEMLDHFRMLRLDIVRNINARARLFERSYWQHLPIEDQLIGEYECEWLFLQLKRVEEAELLYVQEVLLPRDMKKIEQILKTLPAEMIRQKKKSTAFAIAFEHEQLGLQEYMTSRDRLHHAGQLYSSVMLAPASLQSQQHEIERLIAPRKDPEVPGLELSSQLNPRQIYGLRRWRERLCLIHGRLFSGIVSLHGQLSEVAQAFNELEGTNAKLRTLLTNQHIPLPVPGTILGWWQYCNVVTRRLHERERKYAQTHLEDAEWITTFIAPLLPMTKEHLSRSLVAEEGSQVGFSLPTKSRGHLRDQLDRIQYGMWEAHTVLISPTQVHTLVVDRIEDMMRTQMSYHEDALTLMPEFISTQHMRTVSKNYGLELFTEHLSKEEIAANQLFYGSAWQAQYEPVSMYPEVSHLVIAPWASFGRHFSTHLRFDDAISLIRWNNGYLDALRWMLYSTPDQQIRAIRDERVRWLQWFRHHDEVILTKSGQKVDLSGIKFN